MTEIKIDFSNTKVAKFYDEINAHLNEIESVDVDKTPSTETTEETTAAAPAAPAPVEEFQTTDQ
jgi:hypothetical protein